jgi:hypothetical protein
MAIALIKIVDDEPAVDEGLPNHESVNVRNAPSPTGSCQSPEARKGVVDGRLENERAALSELSVAQKPRCFADRK